MFPTVPPPRQRLLVFAGLDDAMLAARVHGVGTSSPEMEIEFLWEPSPKANGAVLRQAFGPHAIAMQTGETLGDRIAMAFSERFFFHRTETIVAIGVNEPAITRELIDHAFTLLESCEWVVGPAHDGRCYLIGCRALSFDVEAFSSTDWESENVLSAVVARIRETQRSLAILPEIDMLGDKAVP